MATRRAVQCSICKAKHRAQVDAMLYQTWQERGKPAIRQVARTFGFNVATVHNHARDHIDDISTERLKLEHKRDRIRKRLNPIAEASYAIRASRRMVKRAIASGDLATVHKHVENILKGVLILDRLQGPVHQQAAIPAGQSEIAVMLEALDLKVKAIPNGE